MACCIAHRRNRNRMVPYSIQPAGTQISNHDDNIAYLNDRPDRICERRLQSIHSTAFIKEAERRCNFEVRNAEACLDHDRQRQPKHTWYQDEQDPIRVNNITIIMKHDTRLHAGYCTVLVSLIGRMLAAEIVCIGCCCFSVLLLRIK